MIISINNNLNHARVFSLKKIKKYHQSFFRIFLVILFQIFLFKNEYFVLLFVLCCCSNIQSYFQLSLLARFSLAAAPNGTSQHALRSSASVSTSKMADKMDSASLINQANSVWQMLNDLADSDPEAYKKLMDKTLKEGSEDFKPPQPSFCISTVMVSCRLSQQASVTFVSTFIFFVYQ